MRAKAAFSPDRSEKAVEPTSLLQDRGIASEKVSGMYKPGADLSVPAALTALLRTFGADAV